MTLHLGPAPLDGGDENWVPTHPDRPLEALIRFYGPTPAFFEKNLAVT